MLISFVHWHMVLQDFEGKYINIDFRSAKGKNSACCYELKYLFVYPRDKFQVKLCKLLFKYVPSIIAATGIKQNIETKLH